jgi:cytosine/adenosine deaminase-related metal-dependent hydrolase
LIVHRAAWVLPIAAAPIRHGWVAVEAGRIVALGGPSDREPEESVEAVAPVESRAILPGLVNAHVHLELSWMRGAVPPASSMPAWAASLIAKRRTGVREPVAPIRQAIDDARRFGTALVGDVTNGLASYEALSNSPLSAAIFYEQLGFRTENPVAHAMRAQATLAALRPREGLQLHLAPHAPYSVSPGLLQAIGELERSGVVSVHLGESPEEVQFLRDGTGAWRALLDNLGAWDESWKCLGCGPVEYIARAGLVNEKLLAVHGVHLTDEELTRLAAARATLVTCPRSNIWTGAGTPPIARFYESGVRVAVGTDSLASVDDLNVFSELAALRAVAPGVPASRLVESATRIGAEALGFASELGTIAAGKRAELIAVRLPEGVEDVEEYLVGGVAADAITWLTQ